MGLEDLGSATVRTASTRLILLIILALIAELECHQTHNAYTSKTYETPAMSSGCLGQLDALVNTLKRTVAPHSDLRRFTRFYFQEVRALVWQLVLV